MANPKSQKKKICVVCLRPAADPFHASLPPSRKKADSNPVYLDGRTVSQLVPITHKTQTYRKRKKNPTRVGVKCHRTHFAAASVTAPPLQFTWGIREIQVPPYLYFFSFLSSSSSSGGGGRTHVIDGNCSPPGYK